MSHPPIYTALRTYANFSGSLRKAIHRLKYQRDMALGEELARSMIACLAETDWALDLVAPIPISPVRSKERGFNQAALLALPIALYFGVPYKPKALRKQRETHSQVGLSLEERRMNVKGAFVAESNLVSGRRVLVVDDVTTSGATLNSSAKALLSGGATAVYCLTLARAL